MHHMPPSASSVSRNRDSSNVPSQQHQPHMRIDQRYHFHVTDKPSSSVKNMNRNPKSIVCNSNGIIVAEMVYRCLMCRTVFETPLDCRTHFRCFHGEHYGKLLSTFSQSNNKSRSNRASVQDSFPAPNNNTRPTESTKTNNNNNNNIIANNNNDIREQTPSEMEMDESAEISTPNQSGDQMTSQTVDNRAANSDVIQLMTPETSEDTISIDQPTQNGQSKEIFKTVQLETTIEEQSKFTAEKEATSTNEHEIIKVDTDLTKPLVVKTSSRSKGSEKHDTFDPPTPSTDEDVTNKPTHRFPQRIRQTRARLYSP